MTKVSVIVNTVDRLADLKRCLASILNQSFKDFEIVIVNNGNDQETRSFLLEFGTRNPELRIKVIEDKTKKLSYLFNLGWKSSDVASKYLAYLADDTEADPGYLDQAFEYLETHSEAAAVSGPVLATSNPPGEMNYLHGLAQRNFLTRFLLRIYEHFVMEGKTFEPGHWCQSGAFTLGAGIPQPQIKEPIEVDLLTSTSLVIRREALERAGGFDENFLFNHADGDLFIRLRKVGYQLVFHPLVKVWHHMRFGPTRYPEILGRDTAFYFLKDVRPKSPRGFLGLALNLLVFQFYFVFKALETRKLIYLKGLVGFWAGIKDFFRAKTPERKELLAKLAVLLGFLLIFGWAFRRLWGHPMLAFGDATPFPENFKEAFKFFFGSFDPRSPQIINPQDGAVLSSLVPFESLLALLLGGHFLWAQRVFYFLPIPLSFISLYFFVSQFTQSRPARFLTAFIYSANHFMVGEFAGGFAGNLYVPALLPFFLLLLKKIYDDSFGQKNWLRPGLIYSGLLAVAYLISDHVFLILFPFWLIFILAPFFSQRPNKGRAVLKNLLIIFATSLLVLLLTAYHAYNHFKLAWPYLARQNLPEDVIPFFVTNVWDTYWRMTFFNSLRLGGSYFYDFYRGGDLWAKLGFILPVLAFGWPFFSQNRRRAKFKIGLFFSLAALAIVAFVFLTSRGLTLPLLVHFPVLFRFRNPSRLMLLLAFLYSPLIALTLDGWFDRFRRFWEERKRFSVLLFSLITFALTISLAYYFKGFFSGDFTLREHRDNSFWISERYDQVGQFMALAHQRFGTFRSLYLPWNHEEAEVKLLWLDPYTFSVPITYGAYVRNDYLNFLQSSYRQVAEGRTAHLGGALAPGGVKYVLLNSKSLESGPPSFRFDYQTPWLLGSYQGYKKILDRQMDLKLTGQVAGFEVYENQAFDTHKVDARDAGFFMPAEAKETLTRRVLIGVAAAAWALLILALIFSREQMAMLLKIIKENWVVLGFLALFGLGTFRLWGYGMLAYGDATPFPNNFKEAFKFFFGSFDPRMPGIAMPQASVILSTLVPFESLLALLLGGHFLWAQRVFYFLPIPLSFISLYFFVSQFTQSRPARFLTAFIYSANHFMVGEFAGGFAGNLYVPALLPWLVYLLYRLHVDLLTQRWKALMRHLILYSFLQTAAYVLSDHVLFLLGPFWLLFLIALAVKRKGGNLVAGFFCLFLSFLISFLLSAYHAYGYFKIALPFLSGKTIPPDLIPFFVRNVWDTYWNMTPGNVLRLGGSYFLDFYHGSQLWAKAGFLIPLLAFAWWLFGPNRRGFRLKVGLFFSFLAVVDIVIVSLTARGLTLPVFESLPALFRFRNPSRLMLLLAFLYSPLIALTLDGWFDRFRRFWEERKRFSVLLFSLITFALTISLAYYFKGFFSGDFTLREHRGESFYISEPYYRVADFLSQKHQEEGEFRTAYFPWNHEDAEMKLFWLDPYALGVPIEYGAYIQNDYLEFIKKVYRRVEADQMTGFGRLLSEGGVAYVVLNGNIPGFGKATYHYDYHVPWLLSSYNDLFRIISSAADLSLVADVSGFKVYENLRFAQGFDPKTAGLGTPNQVREDLIRKILILLTAASWVGAALILFKIGPSDPRTREPL